MKFSNDLRSICFEIVENQIINHVSEVFINIGTRLQSNLRYYVQVKVQKLFLSFFRLLCSLCIVMLLFTK